MTELMHSDQLCQLAGVLDQTPQRPIPVLQWSIDAKTGRPTARWALSEDREMLAPVLP